MATIEIFTLAVIRSKPPFQNTIRKSKQRCTTHVLNLDQTFPHTRLFGWPTLSIDLPNRRAFFSHSVLAFFVGFTDFRAGGLALGINGGHDAGVALPLLVEYFVDLFVSRIGNCFKAYGGDGEERGS